MRAILLTLVSSALLGSCAGEPSFSDEIALETRGVLERPDGLEIFALHPYPHMPEGAAEDGADFHGYRILGSTEVDDAAQRKVLIDLVAIGVDESDGTVAACFDPRHGLRVRQGDEVVDLVICFACLSMHLHGPGELQDSVTIDDSPEPAMTQQFESLGLDVHDSD